MAEAKNPLRRLRSENTHFLGLKEEDTLPPGGLLTNKNVLEVILMQKTSENKTPVEKLVCCSPTKTFDTKCGESGGCQQQHNDPTSRCIVGQILERYSQAGIPALKAYKGVLWYYRQYHWDEPGHHSGQCTMGHVVIFHYSWRVSSFKLDFLSHFWVKSISFCSH